VDKAAGDKVSAATTNQSGFLQCRATRVGEDTTLAQIIRMVSDAAATKAPIAKIADRVSGVFVPIVISIAAVTTLVLQRSPLYGVALGTGVFVLGVGYAVAHYRRWRFELQEDALELHYGVFTHVDSSVPYVRVQHVDTERNLLARLVGLSAVVVYTAGSRGADVTIPGLTPARARELHDRLRELAIRSEPEDGV
jgi:membrane protein YdbS with pleckstrin-like domain